MDGCRIIASIIIPPVGVFLQVGLGRHFWLNILLTMLGYIPGLVHAIWIIAKEEQTNQPLEDFSSNSKCSGNKQVNEQEKY